MLDDTLGGEAGAGADVDRVEAGLVELRRGEGAGPHRGVQNSGFTQRSYSGETNR